MAENTNDAFDTQVRGAVTRWVISLWGRLHLAIKVGIIIVPVLIATGMALAKVGDIGERLGKVEDAVHGNTLRIQQVESDLKPMVNMESRLNRLESKVDTTVDLLTILVNSPR